MVSAAAIMLPPVLCSPGPYMLGTGLLLYMLSKEIYVINHETFAAASIGAVIIYSVKKFGPNVAAFADKLNEVGHLFCADHKIQELLTSFTSVFYINDCYCELFIEFDLSYS